MSHYRGRCRLCTHKIPEKWNFDTAMERAHACQNQCSNVKNIIMNGVCVYCSYN